MRNHHDGPSVRRRPPAQLRKSDGARSQKKIIETDGLALLLIIVGVSRAEVTPTMTFSRIFIRYRDKENEEKKYF